MEQKYMNIPKEKFKFADGNDLVHDKKLATKPRGYMADAFSRFCKNKGAIVGAVIIATLVFMAIVCPMLTPYTVSYSDTEYSACFPNLEFLAPYIDFWDGCKASEENEQTFLYYYAMGQESGHNAIKNQEYDLEDSGLYSYRLDSVHKVGMKYVPLTLDQYKALQEYQDEIDRQIIYPMVKPSDRPKVKDYRKDDANYYFKTEVIESTLTISKDDNGDVIPVYSYFQADENGNPVSTFDRYESSMRIDGDGFEIDGQKYYYQYSRATQTGVEVRVNYYEYYQYLHTRVYKDGITTPSFILGTTSDGQDIFTCLFSGARFSFLFGLAVAVVNLFAGAVYGAIEGYYGGKTDLMMERFSDILNAVPTMIVITLLKLYMKGSSQMLVLFIAFFMTGWIGMAATTRMQFYRYKNQEYVLAARTLGAKDSRLIFKHIFPNALGTLVTSCALVIPSMIYSETNLTYLDIINLADSNLTTVGTLIANGNNNLQSAPFIALFPSIFLALLMLSFNLFGNGLRDAFNPSLRGAE